MKGDLQQVQENRLQQSYKVQTPLPVHVRGTHHLLAMMTKHVVHVVYERSVRTCTLVMFVCCSVQLSINNNFADVILATVTQYVARTTAPIKIVGLRRNLRCFETALI